MTSRLSCHSTTSCTTVKRFLSSHSLEYTSSYMCTTQSIPHGWYVTTMLHSRYVTPINRTGVSCYYPGQYLTLRIWLSFPKGQCMITYTYVCVEHSRRHCLSLHPGRRADLCIWLSLSEIVHISVHAHALDILDIHCLEQIFLGCSLQHMITRIVLMLHQIRLVMAT